MPHLHWHLIPRLANDPAPSDPVWRVPHDRLTLPGDQIQATIAHVRKHL
jgi:diadenosine tetraphosphate (Ap4A) HIT family hydrolase